MNPPSGEPLVPHEEADAGIPGVSWAAVVRRRFLVVAAVFIGMGVTQYLAAIGRIELDQWPFVRSKNRTASFAWAAWSSFLGLVALVYAVV